MNHPIPMPLNGTALMDPIVEHVIGDVAGLYFRTLLLKEAGTVVPQHTHDYDHATLVCAGSVRLWVDGEWVGDFGAGMAVRIAAHHDHVFQALEPMTRLTCVHDLVSAESVKRKGV